MKWILIGIVVVAVVVIAIVIINRLSAVELKPDDAAPDFELVGSDGRTYRLSDCRDKQVVVLAWFPKAFTPGCTTECTVMAREGKQLKDFNAAYFTASIDTPAKNKEFAESVGADYPILSDPTGKTAMAYGVKGIVQPVASRWTFFIGKDGRILFIDKDVHPATHAADVAKKLEELGIDRRQKSD